MSVLYPEASRPFSPETFLNPPAVYRGAPFWSWNCQLKQDRLNQQLDTFQQMGLGGGHIHSRTGLATPYMSEAFLEHVKQSTEHAARNNLLIWLYDEDRWPSGAAGGLVTRDHEFRMRTLVFSPTPLPELPAPEDHSALARYTRGATTLLARYAISIGGEHLENFRRLREEDSCLDGEDEWFAYSAVSGDSSWFNHQAYVDTLNPKAIERFRDLTHEPYREAVGQHFGSTIHAIFTDEPQVVHQHMLNRSTDRTEAVFPWTEDLAQTYEAQWQEDLLDLLPYLVFETKEPNCPPVRWRFRDHVAERFASAFADTLGNWCEEAGIALTGHMMEEPTLESQSHSIMEAMRHYRSFQLPGIDMLCDHLELTTAKQAQSAAHQDNRPGVLSELYGVTNWDFPFEGHKRQGDWQAALGITVRVHHLTWVSMAGNSKRDYPASMGQHVPWHPKYSLVEDHFARLNTLLTRGKPRVRVGVVHPIESYWLERGPTGQCRLELESQEERFRQITSWLLYGLLDFDFLCESRLPQQDSSVEEAALRVGAMRYDVIIVPALRTIRSSTLKLIGELQSAGGHVVWAGRIPDCVDALPSSLPRETALEGTRCDFTRNEILDALEPFREIYAIDQGGGRPNDLLYQWRTEGNLQHLFICCTREDLASQSSPFQPTPHEQCTLRLKGKWNVTLNDTLRGERAKEAARYRGGWTEIDLIRYRASSLCLTLEPGESSAARSTDIRWNESQRLEDPVPVTLHEPNVLLLDQAQFRRLGESSWRPATELPRLTNSLRKELGWPPVHGGIAQPWAEPADPRHEQIELRFMIQSEINLRTPRLMVELANEAFVHLDGQSIPSSPSGWYVDPDLPTIELPDLPPGTHELILQLPLTPTNTLEWCYLLGDFGVTLRGKHPTLTSPIRELSWGDVTSQGLPFYGGNITYHAHLTTTDKTALRIPHIGGALVTVDSDHQRLGVMAFDPFRLPLNLGPGQHHIDLTLQGTRVNTFGALHNCQPGYSWWGPPAWQTTGQSWTDAYQLRPCGILVAPMIEQQL